MKQFIFVFFLFFKVNTYAAQSQFISITNDIDDKIIKLVVDADDNSGDIQVIHKVTYNKNGQLLNDTIWDLDKLQGQVSVCRALNKDIIKLEAPSFSAISGGALTIHYIKNIALNTWGQVTVDISQVTSHTGDKIWVAANNGTIARKMHIIANKIFGQAIGIKAIQFRP